MAVMRIPNDLEKKIIIENREAVNSSQCSLVTFKMKVLHGMCKYWPKPFAVFVW